MKSPRATVLLAAAASFFAVAGGTAQASANPGVGYCPKPQGLPAVRSVGTLVVESPPRPKPQRWLRLRTHQSPSGGSSYWEGPEVPLFVPLAVGNMELELLDPIPGGYMAFYRTAPTLGPNSGYEVRLFSCTGLTLVALPLNQFLSRRDRLEVQDIRYADGTLYFNEACQSYSREAGGRCSSLLAVEPLSRRVLWRTPPLTSNNVISVVGQHIVVGYGFTAESDWLRVVRRSDGRILDRESLPTTHFDLNVRGSVLDVEVGGKWMMFQMNGFATPSASLTPLGSRPAPTASQAPTRAPGAATPAPQVVPWPALPAAPTWTVPALPWPPAASLAPWFPAR